MPDDDVPRAFVPLVRVGEVELRNGIRDVGWKLAVNKVSTARIVLERSAVAGTALDWRAEVQIAHASDVDNPVFTGLVDAVDLGEDDVALSLVDGAKPLSELRLGGLAWRGIAAPEMIWSIVRSAGLPADRIDVGDMNVRHETFRVTVPVLGAESLAGYGLAGMTFLGRGPVKRIARDLFGSDAPQSLVSRYEDASLWAQVRCEASTVFEAEQVAIQSIDVALAWVMLMAQYSAPQLPDGRLRNYRRTWALSRARRADVVVVQGEVTKRAWLRALIDQPERPTLNFESIPGLASIQFSTLSEQLREAILAWRRAMEHVDDLHAILAFWESVEFYAAGTTVEKMFEDEDVTKIRAAIRSMFDGRKQQRLSDAIGALNSAPLLTRLRKALENYGVPFTEAEFELVARMRTVRDDFIHGRARTLPSADERSLVVAILGRMLAYRMATVAAQGV